LGKAGGVSVVTVSAEAQMICTAANMDTGCGVSHLPHGCSPAWLLRARRRLDEAATGTADGVALHHIDQALTTAHR
jgi:hypothetical protein